MLSQQEKYSGDTALHLAAIGGHLGVVEVLVRLQIDQWDGSLLDVDVERNNGTLLGKFVDRVVVNDYGHTPLHEASKISHEKLAECKDRRCLLCK